MGWVERQDVTAHKEEVQQACFCNWKECKKDFQAAIQKHGPLQCITMAAALRTSIQKHLEVGAPGV
jgi:hypothetical protein